MLLYLCKFLNFFSLRWIHRLGCLLGYIAYLIDTKSNRIARNNILQSGLCDTPQQAHALMKTSRLEAGKAIVETFFIWGQPQSTLLPLVKQVYGWEDVLQAQALGKGIIFLTPHLGCFEITSIYYGAQFPVSVLFRPPRLKALQDLVTQGRQKGMVETAPANAMGVKMLLQALKSGQAIGILPDQIPRHGEGEWADFFGKTAYTMTLASKLANKTGATVIMAFGERLQDGQGYAIHLTPLPDISSPALLNQAIEAQVAKCPQQYLWQYDRYKQRRDALKRKPDSAREAPQ